MMRNLQMIQRGLWSPASYLNYKIYLNYFAHELPVFTELNTMPPIVSVPRILEAKKLIANCEKGQSAFLHIGDCAEPFEHAEQSILTQKIKFMRKCRDTLRNTKNKQVLIIGRIAGQYAKPRSSEFVEVNGLKIHNYKGDNVNGLAQSDRNPCDKKLKKGYQHSVNSANLIENIFPDLFISHEGLLLPYQSSLTKESEGKFYCQSAHMLWIGERTRQLDGAHVQFFRGVQNPIGVKVSNNIEDNQFLKLVKTLNPQNEQGKLLVIVRMGKQKIKNKLNSLINIKQNEGLNFLFVTDPMHGNTGDSKLANVKTRDINNILDEIRYFEQKMNDSKLNYGYSLEATFQNVTECFGLKFPMTESEISKQSFKSKCDPRLNREQTLRLLQLLST